MSEDSALGKRSSAEPEDDAPKRSRLESHTMAILLYFSAIRTILGDVVDGYVELNALSEHHQTEIEECRLIELRAIASGSVDYALDFITRITRNVSYALFVRSARAEVVASVNHSLSAMFHALARAWYMSFSYGAADRLSPVDANQLLYTIGRDSSLALYFLEEAYETVAGVRLSHQPWEERVPPPALFGASLHVGYPTRDAHLGMTINDDERTPEGYREATEAVRLKAESTLRLPIHTCISKVVWTYLDRYMPGPEDMPEPE